VCSPASLFPQEFGWIDGKRSQGWNGGTKIAGERKSAGAGDRAGFVAAALP